MISTVSSRRFAAAVLSAFAAACMACATAPAADGLAASRSSPPASRDGEAAAKSGSTAEKESPKTAADGFVADKGKAAAPKALPSDAAKPKAELAAEAKKAMESAEEDGARPEIALRVAAGPSSGGSGAREAPSESGLKAGYSDDNEQFNYFVKFLAQYGSQVEAYPLRIGERIVLTVKDSAGKPVSNAEVTVQASGKTVAFGRTFSSGAFHIYPLEYPAASSYKVAVAYGNERKSLDVDRDGPRSLELSLEGKRSTPAALPLDILFVMDTTGSMGEEIERLRSTIEIINANVGAVAPKPALRFGMVLYRDKEDAYLTRIVPFTSDMEAFQAALDEVEADGGGDTPEDLQSALGDALNKMEWNQEGLRLAFVITDAEPHLDYGQSYTYAQAARDAKAKGIKLYTVGSGGLPLQGEYVLRQISQFTAARYIFLTYGEKGESSGGAEASVSHHTGSNFQTDKLEAIIIRFAREELSFLSDSPLKSEDPYFDARKISGEDKDATLGALFKDALRNLADYSTYSVGSGTKAAFLPIAVAESNDTPEAKRQAEYFSEAMLLSAMKEKPFAVVERKDLQKILDEQELQYSGLAGDAGAVKIGSLLGAELMVAGNLYVKDSGYEIFLRLLRVETGEVLSVSKAKLSKDLGI
jgi:Mg-chelatase subunit ChlD